MSGLRIDSFRDFFLNQDPKKPYTGPVHIASRKLQATMVAHGILVIDSGTQGKNRVDSAGVHGDETDAQKLVSDLVEAILSGEVEFNKGKWMAIMANHTGMDADARFAPSGTDMNRCFGLRPDETWARGTYERTRAEEIERFMREFQPTHHTDWHCSIQESERGFYVCSVPEDDLNSPKFRKYLRDFCGTTGINTVIVRPFTPGKRFTTTFEHFSAHQLGAHAATAELGQLKSPLADRNRLLALTGVKRIVQNNFNLPNSRKTPETYRIKREVIQEGDFKFLIETPEFFALPKDRPFGQDGGKNYIGEGQEHGIFAYREAPIGQKVLVVVTPE